MISEQEMREHAEFEQYCREQLGLSADDLQRDVLDDSVDYQYHRPETQMLWRVRCNTADETREKIIADPANHLFGVRLADIRRLLAFAISMGWVKS